MPENMIVGDKLCCASITPADNGWTLEYEVRRKLPGSGDFEDSEWMTFTSVYKDAETDAAFAAYRKLMETKKAQMSKPAPSLVLVKEVPSL